MSSGEPRISVVVPTYQRHEQCARAVASALDQELAALEVLVCDDGSTDETEELFTRMSGEDPRVRYLRLPENHGTPAPARNLGISSARGDWVAFLDSDDRWLPEKLAVQSVLLSGGRYEVVASDATRVTGGPYFGLERMKEPGPEELLAHNPIITSTAVARRSSLLAAGGFPQSVMGLPIGGVEDYGLWLNLAYEGERFAVLPDCLAIYHDGAAPEQLSARAPRQEARAALVRWGLWTRHPLDGAVLGSAVRGTVDAVRARGRAG
jgi:glycosyltransferase involved in cell wall biosynthesis